MAPGVPSSPMARAQSQQEQEQEGAMLLLEGGAVAQSPVAPVAPGARPVAPGARSVAPQMLC